MGMEKKTLLELSRVFSSSIINELKSASRSERLASLFMSLDPVVDYSSSAEKISDIFETSYNLLRKTGNRDEYIYKNALIIKQLLGRHSLSTSTAVKEMRSRNSKADVVIFNGTSTAYEIKSERDNFERLASQLEDYRCTFAAVNVVVPTSCIDTILDLVPEDVGVLALSQRYTIQTIRKPQINPSRIDKISLFNTLRTAEIETILTKINPLIDINIPNTLKRKVYLEGWNKEPVEKLHAESVKTLINSRSCIKNVDLINQLPHSLKAVGIGDIISVKETNNLLNSLNSPISQIYQWR